MKVTSNGHLASQEHVCSLEAKVKDHEEYNGELQEVEKWLLQMSGRLAAPDLLETSSLETITQQLAHHKVRLLSAEPKRADGFHSYVHVRMCTHLCTCAWIPVIVLKKSGLRAKNAR